MTIEQETLPPLEAEEEARLIPLAQQGDEKAMDRLVRANLRFAHMMARHYEGRGMAVEDLRSEAYIGLLTAIRKYNTAMGFKLITYAVWWIRQAIGEALYKKNLVRQPKSHVPWKTKFERTRARLEGQLHEKLPLEVIAEEMKNQYGGDHVGRLEWIVGLYEPYSLDNTPNGPAYPESPCTFHEAIPAPFVDEVEEASERQFVLKWVHQLAARDQVIIKMYYGIDHPQDYTLEEIGRFLGLSRERVRQLLKRATLSLRKKIKIEQLSACQCVTDNLKH